MSNPDDRPDCEVERLFMELLDIRREDGSLTGEVKNRELVHRDGDLHGTSHVFIARTTADGQVELLLQKRADDKDSYPGCYDISSAGHIPAGQDYMESALRELSEELGLTKKEEALHFLGMYLQRSENIFYGRPFINYEVSAVYLITDPVEISDLTLQKEEIASVKWMSLEDCITAVRAQDSHYCLMEGELQMIAEYFQK